MNTFCNRKRLFILIPVILGVIVTAIFMSSTNGVYEEDAYIFFQHARNLGRGDGLSFNPGQVSCGITNIIWTLILSVGHKIGVIKTAQIIGGLLLAITGGLWTAITWNITKKKWIALMVGTIYVLNPRPVWEAVSGMDSILHVFILSTIVYCLQKYKFKYPIILGMLCGIAFLSRPDSLLLLPLLLVYSIFNREVNLKQHLIKSIGFLFTFGIIILPWIIFVYSNTGSLIPPTRTGKLLVFLPPNYGLTLSQFNSLDIWTRMLIGLRGISAVLFSPPSKAIRFILAPSIIFFLISVPVLAIVKRNYLTERKIFIFLRVYSIMLFGEYGFLFPLIKIRYFSFIVPVSIAVTGIILLDLIFYQLIKNKRIFFPILYCLVLMLHFPILAHSRNPYILAVEVQDVRVRIGKWLKENTPPESKIALEPIGAAGFYSDRHIIDMGGLTDTTIWKYIQNGYFSVEPIYKCLKTMSANYIVDYAEPHGILKVADKYPSEFELVACIKSRPLPDVDSYSIYKCK